MLSAASAGTATVNVVVASRDPTSPRRPLPSVTCQPAGTCSSTFARRRPLPCFGVRACAVTSNDSPGTTSNGSTVR